MKGRNLVLALLAVVFLAYLFFQLEKMNEVGFNWLQPQEPDEIFLLEYPKEICMNGTFSVLSDFSAECDYCLGKVKIESGINRLYFDPELCPDNVALSCNGRNLSFSYAVRYSQGEETAWMNATAETANRTLFVHLNGDGKSDFYRPVIIMVDGKIASAPLYRVNGPFSAIEKIPLDGGEHSVEVLYNGEAVYSGSAAVPHSFSVFQLLSILLAIAVAWLKRADAVAKFAIAIVLVSASLVAGFELSKFGAEFLVPLALAGACAWLWKKEGLKRVKQRRTATEGNLLLREALLAGLLFASFIAFVNLFIFTYDVWGAYYFRHAQTTFEQGTTDYYDALSYLGRTSTYPPVFFQFATGVARAFGSSFDGIRILLNWALAFAFGSTTFLLFREYEKKARWLASFLFLTHWALLLTASGIGLHMLAFTLLNCALLLIASNPVAGALSLGIAFACHPITLVFFPFYHYATNRFRLDLRRIILFGVAAVFISLPFYLPIFMRAGLPYEIMPGKWGYLLSYGIDGMRFDFQFLLPLFVACALFGVFSKKYRIPSLLLAGLLLFNTYVSLRSDLVVAMVGAALFPLVFEKWLKDKWVYATVAVLFVLFNFAIGSVVLSGTQYHCSWGLADGACVAPMEYVAFYTPSGSKVAVDPMYGHLLAWKGRRPVLADLYVEYADHEKWEAENECAWNLDCAAAEAYGVDVFIFHDFYRTPRSVPYDRVYDNGFMHVFRKG